MSEQWGLDLDMSFVRLMRRDGKTWAEVAIEKIDGSDIEDRLRTMVLKMKADVPVQLFLPREQILYTDVEMVDGEEPLLTIMKAMEGRTPYALDQLELDWEHLDENTVRVAAIAKETLEEAFAFAETRSLKIAGYSSLSRTAEFPRKPSFKGPGIWGATLAAAEAIEETVEQHTPVETAQPEAEVDETATVEAPSTAETSDATDQSAPTDTDNAPSPFPIVPLPDDEDTPEGLVAATASDPAPEPQVPEQLPMAPMPDALPGADESPVRTPRKKPSIGPDPKHAAAPTPKPRKSFLPVEPKINTDEIPGVTPAIDLPEDVPAFASARKKVRAPVSSSDPVIVVDDTTPVMKIDERKKPLNPGTPVISAVAAPRVRTDVSASTVSKSAATLTPPPSVKLRQPVGAPLAIAGVFGLVALMTVGIAIMVWNLLPLGPSSTPLVAESDIAAPEADPLVQPSDDIAALEAPLALPTETAATEPEQNLTTLGPEQPSETDLAALAPDLERLDPAPTTPSFQPDATGGVAVDQPETTLPIEGQPSIQADIIALTAPETGRPATLAALSAPPSTAEDAPSLLVLRRVKEGLPNYDPSTPLEGTPPSLAGIATSAPFPATYTDLQDGTDDVYIASIETSDLAHDAVALPALAGFTSDLRPVLDTDAPNAPTAPASIANTESPSEDSLEDTVIASLPNETIQGGLGVPTLPEPSAESVARRADELAPVPNAPQADQPIASDETPGTEAPVETAAIDPDTAASDTTALPQPEAQQSDFTNAVNEALADALAGPGGLIPTELAASLPDRGPAARPTRLIENAERATYGGRSKEELALLRPPARPQSEQAVAAAEDTAPTELAIAASLTPRNRPSGFDKVVADAIVQREASRLSASLDYQAPDTSNAIEAALEPDAVPARPAPETTVRRTPQVNIPSSASVARQATIANAIQLNKINLVGVYGAPSDRRALVRLPSGRYLKVKVGDRVDGGTVARITERELLYRKGSRTLSLSLPKG